MNRGDLYRVRRPPADPRAARVYVVVARDSLLRTSFRTILCAPVLSVGEGLATQVSVGTSEGLKHASWIFCDGLTSLPRSALTDYLGSLSPAKLEALNRALRIALDL